MSRSMIVITVTMCAAFFAMSACDKTPEAGSPSSAPEAAKAPASTPTAAPAPKVAEPTPLATGSAAAPSAGDKGKGEGKVSLKDMPNAGKASASDGQSLAKARGMVDTMARELKRSTAAVVMAGKDKDKVDAIGADFQKLNTTMSKQIESISEKLTPAELAEFEDYTRVTLSPLINQLLQAFFSAGGLAQGGPGPNGSTKLVPKTTPAAPAPIKAAPQVTPSATPVANALGAGATGAAPPTPTSPVASAPAAPQPQAADSVPLVVAKGAVDGMAEELAGIVTRIRAANNDPGLLRAINQDYTRINQKHAASLPKLVNVLNDQQKATFSQYLKDKLMPVSSDLVQAFTEAGVTPNQ